MERGFAIVTNYLNQGIRLPQRKTPKSAGYDLEAAETLVVGPQSMTKIPTGLKAFMPEDEALIIYPRSSLFPLKQLMLANSVAVIDADYYDNPGNEGHILLTVFNFSSQPVTLEKGERFAQGLFQKYLKTSDDRPSDAVRVGGHGSTGR